MAYSYNEEDGGWLHVPIVTGKVKGGVALSVTRVDLGSTIQEQ